MQGHEGMFISREYYFFLLSWLKLEEQGRMERSWDRKTAGSRLKSTFSNTAQTQIPGGGVRVQFTDRR